MIPRPLLLNGSMGVGKTTAGRLVAAKAGVPFVDLDAEIERRAGKTIRALFRDEGEPRFREIEGQLLAEELVDPAPRVVALGGGALVDRAVRLAALRACTVVALHADASVIAGRVAGDVARPLLAVPDAESQIARLLAQRADVYAEAHARVDASMPIADVVARVLAVAARDDVAVAMGRRSYVVRIAAAEGDLADVLALAAPTRVLAITDANVAPLVSDDLRAAIGSTLAGIHVIEPGERSKAIEGLLGGWLAASGAGLDRDGIVVGVGGGVVTDLAGFVAGTWLRGVRWIAAPTTLLGMVDAAIGGKTGIDFGNAKNALGAFHQPLAVCTNVARTQTESRRGYVSGLAEVVKSALVGDAALFDALERDADALVARDLATLRRVVRACSAVKADIVSRDEHEGGLRAVLNLGHTLGHALEAAGGFGRWLHGEAVSLGLVAALRVGAKIGLTPLELPERVERLLARLTLPVELSRPDVEAALPFLAHDKKRGGDAVKLVFVETVGRAGYERVPIADLARLFLAVSS